MAVNQREREEQESQSLQPTWTQQEADNFSYASEVHANVPLPQRLVRALRRAADHLGR